MRSDLPLHFNQERWRALLVGGALLLFGLTARGLAQAPPEQTQPTPSPAAVPPPGESPVSPQAPPPKPVALYNLLQERSIVFPDIAYSDERLGLGQKFELFVDNSVSVDAISWSMIGSAVSQGNDSPTGFGQGWGAYGKRFSSDLAREVSGEFFGTFMLASALHEDPRFYAEVNPRFLHAAKYSVQHVFIMRSDDGREVVAWSRLLGPVMAEGLANAYWPDRNRTAGDTLLRYGLDLASRASGNMFREYWPILLKRISHQSGPNSR